MKGETETDVARHTVREAWAATELLQRLGIDPRNLQLAVKVGLAVIRDGETKPLEDRTIYAMVEIRDHGERAVFSVLAGPIGVKPEEFQRLWVIRQTAIGAGQMTEAELRREYEASEAFNGRNDIIEALLNRGFSVRTDLKDESQKPN